MTSELRIKIAESLGYVITNLDGIWPDHYDMCCPNGETYSQVELDDLVADFSTDANAALQLVEALAKEGWEVEIRGSRGDWQCTFYQTAPPNWGEWIDSHAKSAPTLPEAICLAYCAVRGIAEKGKEA